MRQGNTALPLLNHTSLPLRHAPSDIVVMKRGEVEKLREGMQRAYLLMMLSAERISTSMSVTETQFYDEAKCDGLCLSDDLMAASTEIRRGYEALSILESALDKGER